MKADSVRSGRPRLAMKSSAMPPPGKYGIIPSMSRGPRPASSIALRLASSCNARPDLVVPRVYSVSPMPLIAALSRSACAILFPPASILPERRRSVCLDIGRGDDFLPAHQLALDQVGVALGAQGAGPHADLGEGRDHLLALQGGADLALPAL